jgi:hypothetical protein
MKNYFSQHINAKIKNENSQREVRLEAGYIRIPKKALSILI